LRENSGLTVMILTGLSVLALMLIFINRSISQFVSGSVILKNIGDFFVESGSFDKETIKNKRIYYVIAGIIGVLLSVLLVYTSAPAVVITIFVAFAVLFLAKYLPLGIFITVALSPILPTMALVGLSFMCAAVFLFHTITNEKFTFNRTPLNVGVIFFVIALIWGCINSFNSISSIKQVLVHLSFVLFYFVLVNVIRTKKQWLALVKVFMLSAFIVGMYGIAQNFLGAVSTESWIDEKMFSDIKLRVYSFFNNPNVLGEFLVLTIPVAVALTWNKVKEGYRVIYGILLLSLAACMVFTWSRGAWLGMILAIALFLAISDRRWIFAGVVALFLLPVLLHFTGNTAIIDRFLSIGNTADTSTAYRVSIWRAAINMIRDFWVGGIGIGSDAFVTVYPSYSLSGAKFALHSHNLYLQFWVETGVIGIVSLLGLLFGYLKTVFSATVVKSIKKSDIAKILVALGAGITGFMFQGLTDYVWYNYKILMIFWIVIALGVSGAEILKNEEKGGVDSL